MQLDYLIYQFIHTGIFEHKSMHIVIEVELVGIGI